MDGARVSSLQQSPVAASSRAKRGTSLISQMHDVDLSRYETISRVRDNAELLDTPLSSAA